MSKTFRYSQDGECGCSRERRARRGDSRRCDQADGSGAGANGSSRCGEDFVMSLECAIGRMARHMEFEAGKLVADGIVPASEKEDAQSVMRSAAIRAYPMYDASRLNEQGVPCGVLHYLTVAVDNAVSKMRRFHSRLRRRGENVPIALMDADAASRLGFVAGASLGDGCRGVRDLEFRMDVNTLRGMLTPPELEAFDLMIGGCSHVKIAESFGISESWFRRSILERIRRKAEKCGFSPLPKRGKKKRAEFGPERVIDVGVQKKEDNQ